MTKSVSLTVPLVLLGAARLLRERIWSRGLLVSPDARQMCMVGAIETFISESGGCRHPIMDAVVLDNLRDDAVNQTTRTIWHLRPDLNRPHVTAYNDRYCKSAEEAATMLEAAAALT